jgi:RNA polymerase-binding transcription factor DksA
MSPLSPDQLDALRRLMDERWTLEMREIRSVAERSRDDRLQEALAGRAADRLDEALAEIWQRSDHAIIRQNIQDVRDIEAARGRIGAGTYGVCVECGREIGYERLLAYPTAKRCIDCQREHERRRARLEGRVAP